MMWAGELPVLGSWQAPAPDPALDPDIPVPPHIAARAGAGQGGGAERGHRAVSP